MVIQGAAFGACAWMQEARKSPEWFTSGVMYQIQPRAFTPEGTLKAAEKKLPYLKDLGVTIAYLVPVFKMDADMDRKFWSPRQIKSGFNNPKNQYRIADYFHVDDEYGSDKDLKDFCAKAHELGMQVIFDLVYLHCGPTAPFLKEHPEFTWWNADGSVKKGPWRFPKLNFAEPKLREYLIGNVRYLLTEFGCDGFRCDVGDGIPLDFWCDVHDVMDAVTAGHAILLCEGFTVCDQYKGFDADYGWFPNGSARAIEKAWTDRMRQCPVGSRFVNHYENHDIATDLRPRREKAWGHDKTDQVLVWMFTLDGIPMLFTGNEFADDDESHSMFGKTPVDWTRLDREPGKSRFSLVKRLAALRRGHPALTAANGEAGLTWLRANGLKGHGAQDGEPVGESDGHGAQDGDCDGLNISAFVRRGKGETLLVVQNWGDKPVEAFVDFNAKKAAVASYIALDAVDYSVEGTPEKPLLSKNTELEPAAGGVRAKLGPWGYCVVEVK